MKKEFIDYVNCSVWDIIGCKIEQQSNIDKKIMHFCCKKESLRHFWWKLFFFKHPNLKFMIDDEEEKEMWKDFLRSNEGKSLFKDKDEYKQTLESIGGYLYE